MLRQKVANLFLFSHCHSPFPLNYFPLMLPLPLLRAAHTPGSPPAASCPPTTALHFTRNLGCLLWQASSIPGDLRCERLTVCGVLWLTLWLKDAACVQHFPETNDASAPFCTRANAGSKRLMESRRPLQEDFQVRTVAVRHKTC